MGFEFLKDTASIVRFKKRQPAVKFCFGSNNSRQLKDVGCKTKRIFLFNMMHMHLLQRYYTCRFSEVIAVKLMFDPEPSVLCPVSSFCFMYALQLSLVGNCFLHMILLHSKALLRGEWVFLM